MRLQVRLLTFVVLAVATLGAGCGRTDLLSRKRAVCPPGDLNCIAVEDGGASGDARGDGRTDGGDLTDGAEEIDGAVPRDARPDGTGHDGSGGPEDGPAADRPADSRPDARPDGGTGNDGPVADRPADSRPDARPDGGTGNDGPVADRPDGGAGNDGPVADRPADSRPDGGSADRPADSRPDVPPPPLEICTNGIDDDRNKLIDCADPACFGAPACFRPGQEICNNLLDDDGDGAIDCRDADCATSAACRPSPGGEICDDFVDNNGDRLVDCSDPQCVSFPACLSRQCTHDVDFGTVAPHDARVSRTMDTRGATRSFATCATPGGHARVGQVTLSDTADLRVDFTQAAGAAHVVSVFRAGVGQACDQNLITCLRVGQTATATTTLPALAAGVYWIVVQSFPGTDGSTTVTLSTGPSGQPEVCNNGVDDDRNGLTDCADSACRTAPSCTNSQCVPDVDVGTLILDGPERPATVVTAGAPNRYHPTCAGTSTGGDRVVAFTLPEAGGVQIRYSQTGDHVFSLFRMPGPGLACDHQQAECAYLGQSAGALAIVEMQAGRYLLILKPLSPGDEGRLDLRLSAFSNRRVESCANGIDDDNNGFIDCDDPACLGVGDCGAAMCMPDSDVGDISWGTVRPIRVTTVGAPDIYQSVCARGDGAERVVRLRLTQPMALGVSCSQTGSHVLELSMQVAPLDACDAHIAICADSTVLPFGCNYALPNLQPGTYNLIVEAFQPGSEGTMDITLYGMEERVREICDNGSDDDADGYADCADLKCVTEPVCAGVACHPDRDMGLVPLDGTPVSSLVETSLGLDDQRQTACVAAPGGQDNVVDLQIPATADLTLQWAQVGDHVFAVYVEESALLACDAGRLVACIASDGAPTGSATLPAMPAGPYHVVIDAARPGSEGGVVVQVSGRPAP